MNFFGLCLFAYWTARKCVAAGSAIVDISAVVSSDEILEAATGVDDMAARNYSTYGAMLLLNDEQSSSRQMIQFSDVVIELMMQE